MAKIVSINSNPYKIINPKEKPHLGEQATKNGRLYGDKRCMTCGDWITWADVEPEYCFEPSVIRKLRGSGKEQCRDWYERRQKFLQQQEDAVAERAFKLYEKLKKMGVVA